MPMNINERRHRSNSFFIYIYKAFHMYHHITLGFLFWAHFYFEAIVYIYSIYTTPGFVNKHILYIFHAV